MKKIWYKFIEALKLFWFSLFEKEIDAKDVLVTDNMLIPDFGAHDPYSRTALVLFHTPIVFENDIKSNVYRIIKIRKSTKLGLRFDLENESTGHIARRVSVSKIRGLTSWERQVVKPKE